MVLVLNPIKSPQSCRILAMDLFDLKPFYLDCYRKTFWFKPLKLWKQETHCLQDYRLSMHQSMVDWRFSAGLFRKRSQCKASWISLHFKIILLNRKLFPDENWGNSSLVLFATHSDPFLNAYVLLFWKSGIIYLLAPSPIKDCF